MTEQCTHADILNALDRAATGLEDQAKRLTREMDYSAMFPEADARAIRRAIALLSAPGDETSAPGARDTAPESASQVRPAVTPEWVWSRLVDALDADNGCHHPWTSADYKRAEQPLKELIEAGYFADDCNSLDGSFWMAAAGEESEAAEFFASAPVAYAALDGALDAIFDDKAPVTESKQVEGKVDRGVVMVDPRLDKDLCNKLGDMVTRLGQPDDLYVVNPFDPNSAKDVINSEVSVSCPSVTGEEIVRVVWRDTVGRRHMTWRTANDIAEGIQAVRDLAGDVHAASNAAINFALDLDDSFDAVQFLRDWREGAWDEWPDFLGPFPEGGYIGAAAEGSWEGPKRPAGCIKPDTHKHVFFYEQDFYVLSNFSAFSIDYLVPAERGPGARIVRFPTSEHLYHYLKFATGDGDRSVIEDIIAAPSAHAAFKLAESKRAQRRRDWDEVKVDYMRDILRAKVDQHEYVRRKLLATGDRQLIEDSWRDDVWGWGPNRDGQNLLGKLWMQIRAEIRIAMTWPASPELSDAHG